MYYYLTVMPRKSVSIFLLVGLLLFIGCRRTSPSASNNTNTEVETSSSSPVPQKTGFEADLEYVRKGQYTYVWVFSRKDGKVLDKEDALI